MEENKYLCPRCGTKMNATYVKPALNLICPNCGCQIATTKWEDIDLDDQDYEIVLKPANNPSIDKIKTISILTGLNYIDSKSKLEKGEAVLKAKAPEIRTTLVCLKEHDIEYLISPYFPY